MKYVKMLGLAAVAAMAMMAFSAGTASATTLETTGVTTLSSESITASLDPEAKTALLALTGGGFANTCTESHVHGKSTVTTGSVVSGPIESLTFTNCARPVTVHKGGSLSITHIAGTTNATLRSANAEATVGSPIGTLTCTTPAAGTHLGTVTGSLHGHATIHILAVLNCGFLAPSANWSATYKVTSPTGLGVSA